MSKAIAVYLKSILAEVFLGFPQVFLGFPKLSYVFLKFSYVFVRFSEVSLRPSTLNSLGSDRLASVCNRAETFGGPRSNIPLEIHYKALERSRRQNQ